MVLGIIFGGLCGFLIAGMFIMGDAFEDHPLAALIVFVLLFSIAGGFLGSAALNQSIAREIEGKETQMSETINEHKIMEESFYLTLWTAGIDIKGVVGTYDVNLTTEGMNITNQFELINKILTYNDNLRTEQEESYNWDLRGTVDQRLLQEFRNLEPININLIAEPIVQKAG